MIDEAYRLHCDLNDVFRMAISVCRFAGALAAQGHAALAAHVLGSGEARLDEMGASAPWASVMNERLAAELRSQLGEVTFADERERGRRLPADLAVALAREALALED